MTRAAAASLLRAALLSPRPPRPRHDQFFLNIDVRRSTGAIASDVTISESRRAMARSSSLPQLSDSMDEIPVKLMSDGRIANRNGTGVTSWIGGMSITHDGNLIAPDKIMTHIHRYASPHYNPHGHHYHRWNHEPGGSEDPLYATKTVYGPGYIDENQRIGKENGKPGDEKVALQSTCHVALDACIKDSECVTSLTPVLQKCHTSDCDREGCMAALRGFYRKTGVHWNTEIAFCLCKKTDNREDSCMNAQERLHPSCAQRPAVGSPLPACHTLAHACREEPECRSTKLVWFFPQKTTTE
ncbi:unnamed protein product [Spodoptera exigua]|nr:unnamed protein product [Spodoptera exigua]